MWETWVQPLGWDGGHGGGGHRGGGHRGEGHGGGGHGHPFQYPYLENPHGQRSLGATVHAVAESHIGLGNFHFGHFGLLID